jgi:PAS domain S-box-containing protein
VPSIPSSSDDSDYSRLFRLSLDLLCVAGLDGYFKKVNPAWTQTLGWSEAELLARPVADFMHPDDRERTLHARGDLAKGILLRGLENRYLCKNGSYRWLSWQSSVELAEGKVFAVARDITERRRQDREQLVLSKLESTGILAGGIAHDFNNLLGGLLLNLEMVSMVGSINADQKNCLEHALQAVRAAEALTHQLQTFAQGGTPVRRALDLTPLLQQSVELALADSAVTGECKVDPALWRIEADEVQLAEVVRGVVLNAQEAMAGDGRVVVEAANVVLAEQELPPLPAGRYVRITVADSGRGISAENLPKVFGPYFTTKARGAQKGVGLGLSICRTIVREHGGAISLESREGRGTTVTLHLPAATRSDAAQSLPAPGSVAASRILIMDDDAGYCDMVARALRRTGYRVDIAADAAAATALHQQAFASGDRFALALLSWVVRDGRGAIETMNALRACDSTMRGVLVTAFAGPSEQATSMPGFAGVLRRPFSAETLHRVVADALQGGARSRERVA